MTAPRWRIVFYHGKSFQSWTPDDLERRPLGGLETAAIWMAYELRLRGCDVTVYGDCGDREGDHGGVLYRPWTAYDGREPADLLVVTRWLDVLERATAARVRWVWVHDHGVGIGTYAALERAHRLLALSKWHRDFLATYHGLPFERFTITRNGLDLSRFAIEVPRQRHRLIYTSAAERGLDIVLEWWPAIRQLWPDAELHIFVNSFAQHERARREPAVGALWERVQMLARQEGVVWREGVDQRTLAIEFLKSDAWLYPTRVKESFSITALEAQAAGCIPVASMLGALPEVIKGGILLPPGSRVEHYLAALASLDQPARRAELEARGRAFAAASSWGRVAEEWLAMLDGWDGG